MAFRRPCAKASAGDNKSPRCLLIADVQLALTNVCFGGKNGHDADAGQCPPMTRSGYSTSEMLRIIAPRRKEFLTRNKVCLRK